ncbi:hypothetical protein CC85DRAFT_312206 [Cutaneotrichosporon oleaginosum]|uniref:Uncharacterized protein n=1 Tax=Cutaneotrichosporon oleaginosum TaxID=879819 RepID=A0A0J1B4H1_9TREE|nr:uncharacterized protein CC85DRAFT_312206 [Cutaneotrichosporon oleaginosum]KLT42559.1 hypothetical protein CC85DRAFT_312206 [Cutaneotrichosporon oleaginosum]TXT15025.1 hypothetical protein COLE_01218 [Cutaneotrichosporon oleaginosum]
MGPHAPLAPPTDDITPPIFALTCLRLLLSAAAVSAFAPGLLGGAERELGMGPALATLASPVVYAAGFSLLLFCRPRGASGAALLLLLGAVEGAAIGAALALLGWGWAVKMALVALVAGGGVFGGLAIAAYHAPGFRELSLAAALLCGLVGSGIGLAIHANTVEIVCAWVGVLGGTLFALRDMPGVLGRVGADEAGLGAAVLGMSAILDSVARDGRV